MNAKRPTIKFYTDSGRYMTWLYATNDDYIRYLSWVRSGYSLVFKGKSYDASNFPVLSAILSNL